MTNYYQCISCAKTSEQEHCKVTVNDHLICPYCLDAVKFAFSVCVADQPEPSIGFCDGCDELEAKLHLMDGDWLCDTCKLQVIKVKTDKLKAQTMRLIHTNAEENKTMVEAVEDLKTSCTDHWEMIKARVFITIFVVWVCFAIWGKYVS